MEELNERWYLIVRDEKVDKKNILYCGCINFESFFLYWEYVSFGTRYNYKFLKNGNWFSREK